METKERLKAYFDENLNDADYESLVEWVKNTIQRWRLDVKDKQRNFDNEIKNVFKQIPSGKKNINDILDEIAKLWPKKYECEDTSKMIDEIEAYIFEKIEVNEKKEKK